MGRIVRSHPDPTKKIGGSEMAFCPVQQAAPAAPQAAPAPGGLMTPGAPAGPQNGPQIAIPPAPPAASTVVPNVTAPPIFGDAFKMFPKFFKNPSGANREALDGHLSFGASMILGGLYFLIAFFSPDAIFSHTR